MSLRVIIAVTALSGVLIAVPAQADTKDDLDAAREELASKQAELDAITLQWQQTETAYAQAQDAVHDAQEQIATLQAQLVRIQREFDKQVRAVYISGGSEAIGALLGSESFSDFADRLGETNNPEWKTVCYDETTGQLAVSIWFTMNVGMCVMAGKKM